MTSPSLSPSSGLILYFRKQREHTGLLPLKGSRVSLLPNFPNDKHGQGAHCLLRSGRRRRDVVPPLQGIVAGPPVRWSQAQLRDPSGD